MLVTIMVLSHAVVSLSLIKDKHLLSSFFPQCFQHYYYIRPSVMADQNQKDKVTVQQYNMTRQMTDDEVRETKAELEAQRPQRRRSGFPPSDRSGDQKGESATQDEAQPTTDDSRR